MTKKKTPARLSVDGIPILMDVDEIAEGLQNDKVVGFDTETTGFSAWRNNIALIQLYGQETGTLGLVQCPDGVVPPKIAALFDQGKTMVCHNFTGFDAMFLDTHGVKWQKSKWYDTLVGETVLATTGRRDVSVSLRASLKRRLGKTIDKDIEHSHWNRENLTDDQILYAAQDVISLPALRNTHLEKAKNSNELEAIEMEMELVPYVARMTINGLPMPRWHLESYVETLREQIADTEKYLIRLFGKININSPAQLKKALHAEGIYVTSTGAPALVPLSQMGGRAGEIAEKILFWKHGAQRIKMYSQDWMDEHIIDDWVHPRFWQCSADTTRFTCSNPNLQQVPKDSRFIIGHVPGMKIVSVDYSQIEVRITAHYAKDEALIESLETEDVHTSIASQVFQVPTNEVTADQRKLSKALTFTLLFGGGESTLYNHAKMSGGSMTEKMAKDLSDAFFATFKGVKAMKDKAIRLANKDGVVVLRLPNTSRRILAGQNKRPTVILNTIVQGTAAVGIKHGMLEAGKRGLFEYIGSQVHDELVAAVPDNEVQEFTAELEDAMQVGMGKVLPLTVKTEAKIGDIWKA